MSVGDPTYFIDDLGKIRSLKPIPDEYKINNSYFYIKMNTTIDYKYSEDVLIDEIKNYIDATYNEHYSQNKFQATEFIMDSGHGEGFCIGNIMKYAQRYGKKDGYNRKDLLKVIHYAIMALHNHDVTRSNINNGDADETV